LLHGSPRDQQRPVAWVRGRAPAGDVEMLIPADWCLRRHAKGALAVPGAALSTGCAAGASFEAAASRALLELVERDAVALWWIGGQRPKPLAAESAAAAEAVRLLGILRQGRDERASWLLDLTTDLGIPCMAAVSVDDTGRGLACGFAARVTAVDAARAAILEMCQMELGLVLAAAKREQAGEAGLNEVDRRHLDRAARIDAERCALVHPLGSPSRNAGQTCDGPREELAVILATLGRHDMEVGLIDLTRPEFGIPVVWAVAPQLQLLPCSLRTERLQRMTSATGGGDRWTGDVALL
jgi:ribosomal protein S12 methylthiotransferase accessory factor